jgi:hypothetical protein
MIELQAKVNLIYLELPDNKPKRKYDKQHHKDITHLLAGVRREMLNLIKVHEFLRNIDCKMESSLNYLEGMMCEVYTELEIFEKKMGFFHLIKLRLEYIKFKILFSGFKFFLFLFPFSNGENLNVIELEPIKH